MTSAATVPASATLPHPSAWSLAELIVDSAEIGVFAVDRAATVLLWNRFMETHSRRARSEVVGRNLFECFSELPRSLLEKKFETVFALKNYAFTRWEQRPFLFRFDHSRPFTAAVGAMQQNATFIPVFDDDGEVSRICVTLFDCTDAALAQLELKRLLRELASEHAEQVALVKKLEEAHHQLYQSEKLAAIGQLAAGVAHEINNPIGFVNSNVARLGDYANDLLRLVDAFERAESVLPPETAAALARLKSEIDLDFVRSDLAALLDESRDGLDRVKRIVQDLKDFSRIDAPDWQVGDIHRCLDSTLNVVWNELKYKAEVRKSYGARAEIECVPSQLNQVFMNLLVNAAQAIAERGTIDIATRENDGWIVVEVADSGVGMPPDVQKRIFDPFFTTKPVGQGTGLGLSVSYNIVKKHGGRIEVESVPGQGTTFRIWLPLRQPSAVPGTPNDVPAFAA